MIHRTARSLLAIAVLFVAACGGSDSEGAQVEVIRDEIGVVHLYGPSDIAVSYASGYMQAHDRLFQMDLQRRRALGRRAEVLGPDVADDDVLMRRVGIARLGRDNAAMMAEDYPEIHALIEAWVRGVNARIDEVRDGEAELPYGFGPDELDYLPERWETADAYAVGKMTLFGNANQLQFDILTTIVEQLVPELDGFPLHMPLRDTFILPDAPIRDESELASKTPTRPYCPWLPADAAERLRAFVASHEVFPQRASNNWAVDGQHTENGRPLLANDPHQPLESPSLMWAQHLSSAEGGGSFDVAGFGFVGTPSVQLGHNRHIAWAATTTYPDMMDIWDVEAREDEINVGGEWVAVESHTETVEVRGEDAREVTVERVPGYGILLAEGFTPVPLVSDDHRILFNWTGFEPTHEVVGFQAFQVAEDLDDFEAGVERMEIAAFNFVAASAGGIRYRSAPRVPDTGPAQPDALRNRILDGSDPDTLWSGEFLDASLLPRSDGGQRGWIATANNDPYGFTENGRFEDDPFYFGSFFDGGTRASRIENELQRLVEEGDITVEAMQSLQTDTYSVYAEELIPLVVEAQAQVGEDADLAEYEGRDDLAALVQRLDGWNRHMERDASEAVLFEAFMYFATREAIGDDMGIVFDSILEANPGYPIKLTLLALTERVAESERYIEDGPHLTLLRALDETADYLEERFGGIEADDFTWSDLHGTRFDHPWPDGESIGWVATDGSVGTVNVSEDSFFEEGEPVERLESTHGAIFRMITRFDEDGTPRAVLNYPPGNVGDPESAGFDATLEDWVEDRYTELPFDREAVEANAAERRTVTVPTD